MSFEVSVDAYDAFMGRWSRRLAAPFADFAGVSSGMRVLDVGCGTGALTEELLARLPRRAVMAVDPSTSFVTGLQARLPDLAVMVAGAEGLPFGDRTFDASLALLVVHFMADPVAGLAEMARVTRRGGVVAASVWDYAGDRGPLGVFWEAAGSIWPDTAGESRLAGAREGHLAELLAGAGLHHVTAAALPVTVEHATFEEWWGPFTRGAGPAGAYVAGLAPDDRERLRLECRRRLPTTPIVVTAAAWTARGMV